MKTFTFFVLFIFSNNLFANTENFILNSNESNPKYTTTTISGQKYRITVEGAYHQWPKTQNNCFGVDAVWYYDIPKFDNPILDPAVAKMLESPIWLGDSSSIVIPSVPPLFDGMKIGLRQYTGFRFNDEPLSKYPLQPQSHRYQFEAIGNGKPFKFQILDSVLNLQTETVIPRYEDNYGSLYVTVESIEDTTINICDTKIIKDEFGNTQIIVKSSIMVKDSNSTNGSEQILYDLDQIGVLLDNHFVCPDSLVCNSERTYPIATGLVIDNSASMSEPISQTDLFTTRMEASLDAIDRFINSLQRSNTPRDSAFIVSFSNRPNLVCDWTDNKDTLKNSLCTIKPDSSTALYTALLFALEKVSKHPNPKKAVIILTDGDNTRGPIWSEECLSQIKEKYSNIQIYFIGLSFTNTTREKLAIDTMNLIVSYTVKGKIYKVNDKDSLSSLYSNISTEIASDNCCSLYFRGTPCDGNSSEKEIKLVFAVGNSLLVKSIFIKCPDDSTVTYIKEFNTPATKNKEIFLYPNPLKNYTNINFSNDNFEKVEFEIINSFGEIIDSFTRDFENGEHTFVYNTENLSSGFYFILVRTKSQIMSKSFVVIK